MNMPNATMSQSPGTLVVTSWRVQSRPALTVTMVLSESASAAAAVSGPLMSRRGSVLTRFPQFDAVRRHAVADPG
jgi:hypothetical protein